MPCQQFHALKNVLLRMEQFRLALDFAMCLSLARRFVNGKIRNHRTMLMQSEIAEYIPLLTR